MSNWKTIVLTIFVTLLTSGLILLVSRQTTYSEIELLPIPSPRPLVIHITGEVVSPGVYEVPVESRISEVAAAAGGFTENADQQAINLAQMVSDGQKIIVPHRSIVSQTVSSPSVINIQTALINVNTATMEMLSTLPGIGPAKANDIIEYREAHGFFSSVDELMNVKGIGPANFDKIKGLITLY